MKYLKMLAFALAAFFAVNFSQAAIVDYTYRSGSLPGGEGWYTTETTWNWFYATSYSFEYYHDDATGISYHSYQVSDGTTTLYMDSQWTSTTFSITSYNHFSFYNAEFMAELWPVADSFYALHPVPAPPPPPEW